MKIPALILGTVLAVGATGCATTQTDTSAGRAETGALDNSRVRSGYGTVESVERAERSNIGMLGTIGGAVVGGLLGHQVGSGRGNTAATIAGAAGGAYAGREIERRTRGEAEAYRIVVRMDDGSYQAIGQEAAPAIRQGDRVRIENGTIYRL